MRARELEVLLEGLTPRSASDLATRTQKLRDAKMLPVGGRGLHAPDIEAHHAATILIACAGCRNSVDSAIAARAYSNLVPFRGPKKSFAAAETFGQALAIVLGNMELAMRVLMVELVLPVKEGGSFLIGGYERAAIVWKSNTGKIVRADYLSASIPREQINIERLGAARMEDITRIGAGLLKQISIDLAAEDQGEILE
jgi:hypothetical protein